MKKFVTLFTDSARELKSVRTITTMAMLAAVAVILGYFSIEYGQFIRIGFSGIPNEIVHMLFGPVVGSVFAGTMDIHQVSDEAYRTILSTAYTCCNACRCFIWMFLL